MSITGALRELEKQQVMEVIFTEYKKKLRPIAIYDDVPLSFFDWHDNRFEGHVVKVRYIDHEEVWFVASGDFDETIWHVERIW